MSSGRMQRAARWLRGRLVEDDGPGDGGFGVVELVVLVPIFMTLLLLVVAAGRVQDNGVRITGAARDGARAASLERTADGARAAARRAVRENLAGEALECAGGPVVNVDVDEFAPGGQVRVRVRCVADLRDVAIPGLPGRVTLRKTATSPVEQYRGQP